MLRRDYILNAIEEFAGVLSKMLGFVKENDWQSASLVSAQAFQKLTGTDAAQALEMSPTQLFARLLETAPTHLAEARLHLLATLFKAQGELLAKQGRMEESRQYHLKGLHLLLEAMDQNSPGDRPDFLTTVESFLISLGGSPLPMETQVMLMRHYEKTGEWALAEDALFAIVETNPSGAELLEFGETFYQRLSNKSDAALAAGNLPRAEAEAGLADFRERMKVLQKKQAERPEA